MCLGLTLACTIQQSSDALLCRSIPLGVRYLCIFISTPDIRVPLLSDCPNAPCRNFIKFLPPTNEVVERQCFHRCLSVILSLCDHYPWCIGTWVHPPPLWYWAWDLNHLLSRSQTWYLPAPAPATEIWWSSLKIDLNVFTWGPINPPSNQWWPPKNVRLSSG